MMDASPGSQVVDIAFQATGDAIPLDHGYRLFSGLSRLVPALHELPEWGLHPVFGVREGAKLALEHRSLVKIRMPLSEISAVIPLAGSAIDVAGARLELGFPRVLPLVPSGHIRARFVTVRGFQEGEEFIAAVRRQLDALELDQDPASIELVLGRRRVMRIHSKQVVGFALGLMGLEAEASLVVQRRGLGGRRHMGGGIFVPPGRNG